MFGDFPPHSSATRFRFDCPAYCMIIRLFFFKDAATTEFYTLSLHDALPISPSILTGCSVIDLLRPPTSACAFAPTPTAAPAVAPAYWPASAPRFVAVVGANTAHTMTPADE